MAVQAIRRAYLTFRGPGPSLGLRPCIALKRALLGWMAFAGLSGPAFAYSANRVWFEFRPQGIYRVYVNYTVPELKEFRESYVEFRQKKAAEKFYYDLLRGADFYPPDPGARRFQAPPRGPRPW